MVVLTRIAGLIAIFLAIVHFFFPQLIGPMDELGRKTLIEFVKIAEKYRIAFGIFYILGAIFLFYYAR